MRTIAITVVAVLLVAGCVAPEPNNQEVEVPFTDVANPLPIDEGHDHTDPSQHRFARNANLLAHDDLQRFGASAEVAVGAHAAAMHEGLLAVAVSGDEQQGLHLFNVSAPGQMEHLAFYNPGVEVFGDRTVAFSADGLTVFLGRQGGSEPGVEAIDVSDPKNPVQVGFWADPANFGPHTVGAGVIAGQQYVFLLSYGVTTLRYDDGEFTLEGKYVAADGLSATELPTQAEEEGPGYLQTYAFRSVYGHDMTLWNDNVTGKDFLLVAYAYDGFKVLDMSIPSAPVMVASWVPDKQSTHRHYVHSAGGFRGEDGRAIFVVGSETFEDQNQDFGSPIWVLDATEAIAGLPMQNSMELLSTWANPGDVNAGALGRSVHFFRIQDDVLYLSHYHGGIWAVDLRTQEAREDATVLGYILTVPDTAVVPPEDCCFWDLSGAPMVFDVEVYGDRVFAADYWQGVVEAQFTFQ